MESNRDLQQEIWKSKIPISFILAADDAIISDIGKSPDACYVLLHRHAYLTVCAERLFSHFKEFIVNLDGSFKQDIWFEYNDIPLKWHYPAGLLYDLYCSEVPTVPWVITVHFSNLPEETVLRYQGIEGVEAHFMSVIKEADALKHKGLIINSMQKRDHKQLMTGLLQDKFDKFWMVNQRLMERTGEFETFKFIPFRLYNLSQNQASRKHILPMQRLCRAQNDDGEMLTLNDILLSCLSADTISQLRTVIHGIEPPLSTPAQWLSEHLSYPDNFLHIALLPARTESSTRTVS